MSCRRVRPDGQSHPAGWKKLTVGDQALDYDPATYFVSVGEPCRLPGRCGRSRRRTVSGGRVDPGCGSVGRSLSALPESTAPPPNKDSRGADHAELLDAWYASWLMDSPADIPVLAPVFEREILYRVLQGPMGWMLRDMAAPDTTLARVNKVIQRIRREFAQPLPWKCWLKKPR
jgi:hypothetical protein